ncbi:MAG: AAA family ATPase [Acidobacteria bacterium]|nr:AAA family ATPase [Acidobacteriota bacterium]MYG35009.1 AAA family ATPase [Gemmatimonadota bacterium]
MPKGPDVNKDSKHETNWESLFWQVSQVFTPAVPVSEQELFAGRAGQIEKAIDAINQIGQHAVVYGERGVGKTSLANFLSSRLVTHSGERAIAPRVNCDATDSFSSLWKKVLTKISVTETSQGPGFGGVAQQKKRTGADVFKADQYSTPDAVRDLLVRVGKGRVLLVIFDEFDRLTDQPTRRALADTIKGLSDYAVPATITVVGVADTVRELIAEHESIDRSLIQIPMPRMESKELDELLDKGTAKLGMMLEAKARRTIVRLSQGLPPYTHRLALHATRSALRGRRRTITEADTKLAIRDAVENAQQSLRDNYREAVSSPQAGNLFGQVLLACAKAKTDNFGYFAAADVRSPMSRIMGKPYEIPSFARHLNSFCLPERGCVLRKEGEKHRYRYRFTNPLMQPFVIMKGIVDSGNGT